MMEFKKKDQNPDDSFRTNFQSVKGKSKDASIWQMLVMFHSNKGDY